MAKRAKKLPVTLVTFLLDRSGSMVGCRESTIEAFNGYIEGLQSEKDAKIDFTFLQFDSQAGLSLQKICVAQPIADVAPLSDATYSPRGGTPLIDAAYKTIVATAAAVEKRDDKPKVVITIQTDGQENESREHTWEQLSALIAEKTALGWQFNFLGAGINAYDQGAKMGVSMQNTMSYDHKNLANTRSAFTESARVTASYAAGRGSSTGYSMSMRAAAGDKFVPAGLGGGLGTGVASQTTQLGRLGTGLRIQSTRAMAVDLSKPADDTVDLSKPAA